MAAQNELRSYYFLIKLPKTSPHLKAQNFKIIMDHDLGFIVISEPYGLDTLKAMSLLLNLFPMELARRGKIRLPPPNERQPTFVHVKIHACSRRRAHAGLQRNTKKLETVQLSPGTTTNQRGIYS